VPLRVHLRRQAAAGGVDPLGLRRYVKGVLQGEGVAAGGITVVLTDDAGIRDLNARHRGLDCPTDVLAFPLHEELPDEGVYLGDVIVSLQRARDQAGRFHNDPEAELARLLAHGVLHLLGYDHHSPGDGKRMKGAERRALARYLPGELWDWEARA
jgi:probable rRNA maturation factor